MIKYADDTYLLIPKENIRTTENELENIQRWADRNNLKLNITKSKELILKKPRTTNLPPIIPNIPRVSDITMLGVIISSHLKFNAHIDHIFKNIGVKFYMLKRLKNYGLQADELDAVFNALILSRLTYAIQSWWGFAQESNILRLQSFLNRCHRWGYTSKKHCIKNIALNYNKRLFDNISIHNNSNHVLHRYLPPLFEHNHNTRQNIPYILPYINSILSKNFIFKHILDTIGH